MPIRVLICLLCLASLARAEVQFDGYLIHSDGPLFSLVDTDTNNCSNWIRIGDAFEGYTIVAFDKSTDTLVVRKMAKESRLTLRLSKVTAGQSKAHSDFGLKLVARHFVESKFVIRAEARMKGNQWYYRCVEVWKAEGVGPAVGEIFLGYTLETSAPNPAPLTQAEAAALFEHGAPEELLYLNNFPILPGQASGGMPMSHGRLNTCPDVPLDDLRGLLKK
jgi:hypothetical protein